MTAATKAPRASKRASKIQRDPRPIVLSEAETPPLDMDYPIEFALPPAPLVIIDNTLPADIEERRGYLLRVKQEMADFRKWMDGLLFGYIGLDAVISLIPVLGDLFGAAMKFYAYSLARDVGAPRAVKLKIIGYTALDASLGFIPFVGDAADFFLRSHAWAAEEITKHINRTVGEIDRVHLLVMAGNGGQEAAEWGGLRAKLF